jgi:acetyltransferase
MMLDINPLLTDPTGVVAFDARLRVAPKETRGAARAAVAPYPADLESVERLRLPGVSVYGRTLRWSCSPPGASLFYRVRP